MSLQIVVGAVVAAVMADHFSRVAEVVMQKKIHVSSNKTPRRVKLVQSPTPHSISWGGSSEPSTRQRFRAMYVSAKSDSALG